MDSLFLFFSIFVGCVQLASGVAGGHHSGHSGHNTGHNSGHKNSRNTYGPHTDKLYIYTWQIYPDMVVFDWLIKLVDKDRMVGCDLSYGIETGNGKTATGNTSIVENFLPAYRTFKIYPLRSNTTYWLYMTCKDKEGGWHISDTINFTTSVATLYKDQAAAIQSDSETVGLKERMNRGMLSVRPTGRFSPHVLMGLSCVVLSVLVVSVSSALLARRYKQGKTYQIEIDKEIKAFEESEQRFSEEVFMRETININSNDYVDLDSYNEDSITINSDELPDSTEEDDASKF